MKNQIDNLKKLGLLGILLLGLYPIVEAKTERVSVSEKTMLMERWKESPHSMLLSCGTLMYHKEAYKIFKQMPALNFSLSYNYDIPWHHKRTNFFVKAGLSYEGCRRNDNPYQAKNGMIYENYVYNNFHVYCGMGMKIRLTYFLDLSFSAVLDGSISSEYGRYPSLYGQSFPSGEDALHYFRLKSTAGGDLRGLLAFRLTYEIKKVLIFIGCQVYVGDESEKDRDRLNWRTGEQHKDSWAIFGLGYRF